MGYGDNRYGDRGRQGGSDQWRDRTNGDRWQSERGSYGNQDRGRDDDRGFFERAGEQVRSWFSDDDDNRRGGRGYDQDRQGGGWTGSNRSSESFGGGFGNQRGWGDDHFDRQQGYGAGAYERGQGSNYNQERGRSEWGRSDDDRQGYAGGSTGSSWGGGMGADTWGGSGFGGGNDTGRRFDRIDPGHVGAQGSHPMSSPVGGAYGPGFGGGMGGGARSAEIMRNAGNRGGQRMDTERLLGGQGSSQRSYGGGTHDHHYSEWRNRQISQLDQDYDDYRREHQSRFEQEFGGWREKRQTQRQSLGRVKEHMEVLGSDGQHIGTVDKVRGDRVILTKSDPEAGGIHHSIPCSWIETVEDKVTVNKTADEAKTAWQNEEDNRAFFDGDRGASSQGSEGPHMLNRSFSGTYDDRKD